MVTAALWAREGINAKKPQKIRARTKDAAQQAKIGISKAKPE
jgi:hypothetical protein